MRKFILTSLAAILVLGMTAVQAGQFPVKQINVVVAAAPGGASDMTTRIYTQQMEKLLGKPFLVSNRPGAACSIGMEYLKNRRADGYYIGYVPVESVMVRALGITDVSSNDFDFFARAMTLPAAVTVRKEAPYNTFAEFIAFAKENPGQIKVGNSGTGSIWHIAAAAIEEAADVKFNHIPFEGGAPAVSALMGKNVDAVTVSVPEVQSGVDSGDFKILTVLGDTRSSAAPDIATAKELGYDINVFGWGAFGAPKGTPKEVLKVLEEASAKALDSNEVREFFKSRGFEHNYLNGEDMTKFAKEQLEFFDKLINKLGIAN